ncbi:hypothetical protein DQ04_12501000 [Trypanosoma grayi]|uniref:hypothetical protein n=1 Tax=Trypanosoma grayi TaxID=71804 RepID=UPI0004F40BC2|nr:hypothetical protein DQ04_12501000 [Trypanosoma grayi]KEG06739.1 hypothetical protein DQ04_12501000 [Trypanosoma grayi]
MQRMGFTQDARETFSIASTGSTLNVLSAVHGLSSCGDDQEAVLFCRAFGTHLELGSVEGGGNDLDDVSAVVNL